MIGKIRGFLMLCIAFMMLAAACAVIAFVDIDQTWASVQPWLHAHVPWLFEKEELSGTVTAWETKTDQARIVADAVFEALKSGRAKPGDVYDIGQLYLKANKDGQLDEREFGELVDLADRAGIMDQVIDHALWPDEDAAAIPQDHTDMSLFNARFQDLVSAVEQARADGHLSPGEIMSIVQQARASDIQNRIVGMLPPGYDQTQARAVARDLVKAIATGKASINDMDTLVQAFARAQADGRLDHAELDRITRIAESLAR